VAMSTAQRMAALDHANEIRSERARIKRALKDAGLEEGRELVAELLISNPEELATVCVIDLISWIPKVGQYRAETLVMKAGCSLRTRVGLLTDRQRDNLGHELRMVGRGREGWHS
jgi:hypothetical protein